MDDRQLLAMANELASKFDGGLERGTLNDALESRDQFVAEQHPKLADILPIATIAGILDQYVRAGVPKERVWELVCKFYE